MTQRPATEPHFKTKLRVLALWWSVQGVVMVLLLSMWGANIGHVGQPKGNWVGWFSLHQFLLPFNEPRFWLSMGVLHAGFMLLQTLFLLPVRRPRARQARGFPLVLSAAVGGLGATALLIGIGFAAFGIVELFELNPLLENERGIIIFVALWGAPALSWVLGTILVRRFMICSLDRGRSHEDTLSRIASTLFKGTVIEAIAVIPLDVMLRRKTDCYSFSGTMWTLTLCFSVGLLTIGPAIILPLLARRRKEWWLSRCECCGYDMSTLLSTAHVIDRCPECGAGWKPDPVNTPAIPPIRSAP